MVTKMFSLCVTEIESTISNLSGFQQPQQQPNDGSSSLSVFPHSVPSSDVTAPIEPLKRKTGRPRKYVTAEQALAAKKLASAASSSAAKERRELAASSGCSKKSQIHFKSFQLSDQFFVNPMCLKSDNLVAKKFGCKSILGVDIDSNRIEDAYWHLRRFVRMQNSTKPGQKKSSSQGADGVHGLEEQSVSLFNGVTDIPETKDLSEIVSFQNENFVESRKLDKNRYDTILCLSVTKWVHLNWGDEGNHGHDGRVISGYGVSEEKLQNMIEVMFIWVFWL